MRQLSNTSRLFMGIAIFACLLATASCKKNDIDEDGSVELKVVNAVPNSTNMGFYLAYSEVVKDGLDFGEASDYINTTAGSRLVGEFRDKNTDLTYASGELLLFRGLKYTVYAAGQGSDARVKVYQDDLSPPASGKASVNFILFDNSAPSNINVKDGNGDNLVSILTRDIQSGYKDMAAGDLQLKCYDTQSNSIGTFTVPDLQAGKIYTVYITGSTSGVRSVHRILHN